MRPHPYVLSMLLCFMPSLSPAMNLENAQRINQSCALCHGQHGEGLAYHVAPRIAGLPKDYLVKALRLYREGQRGFRPMTLASSIKGMTDQDIEDISIYLAGLDLQPLGLPSIPPYRYGEAEAGAEVFHRECRSCHRRDGLGKSQENIPPLAGQYGSYLFRQMRQFRDGSRIHADDPEDTTFEGLDDDQLDHLVAHVTGLPPHAPPLKPAAKDESVRAQEPRSTEVPATGLDGSMASVDLSRIQIAGRFEVTADGEIRLHPAVPADQNLVGSSGQFTIVEGRLLLIGK